MKLQASPVKQCALDHGIAVAQPRSLRLDGKYPEDAAAARDALLAAQADVMVVAAYGLILPQWVLDVMSAARPPEGAKAPLGGSEPRAAGSVGALRVVGNLPYNISTPILFHLLPFAAHIEDQHFMLQKEVIDRMVAPPATSDYGRLSVMLQWRYAMENVLFVPPESFDPPPRVDSAVVRMIPRADFVPVDPALLSEVVQVAFSQRRKLLRHSLGKWLEARGFSGDFDVQRRAEEVPVPEYLALTQVLQ